MRELSFAEIDMVSGGGWFSDLVSAVAHFAGQLFEMAVSVVENAAQWLADNGFYYKETADGGWEVGFRN